MARDIARRTRARPRPARSREYIAFATSLAFLRHRAHRGTAGPDFTAREQELLHHLWERRETAQPALARRGPLPPPPLPGPTPGPDPPPYWQTPPYGGYGYGYGYGTPGPGYGTPGPGYGPQPPQAQRTPHPTYALPPSYAPQSPHLPAGPRGHP